MTKFIVETSHMGEIPTLTIRDEAVTNPPLVFYLHGFTDRKEAVLPYGYELASRGVCAVAFDAWMHGERPDPRLEAALSSQGATIYPPGTGLDTYLLMHRIIVQTGRDLETLIAHFKTTGGVNTDRIGLTGFSMGGFAAFYAAVRIPEIQAVVPIAGIPAFEKRWRDAVLESASYPEWAEKIEAVQAESEHWAGFMAKNDPFERFEAFYPKPVFIIHGDLDTDCHKSHSVELYRELIPIYLKHPERLRLGIYDGIGNQLTYEMILDAADWFDEFLIGS